MNVAIICEGYNDVEFFKNLINHLSKNGEITISDETEVKFYPCGGKTNVLDVNYRKYKDLKSELVRTKNILFVVDADDIKNDALYGGYENTQNALNEIIAKLEFQEVSSTYIMCDPISKTGYLESFFLSTIPEQQRNCIEQFLECSQFKSKENHKAILNQIYNIAYPNAPYNFAHSHFEELKEKLISLFSN